MKSFSPIDNTFLPTAVTNEQRSAARFGTVDRANVGRISLAVQAAAQILSMPISRY